jgi:hypothetical protein
LDYRVHVKGKYQVFLESDLKGNSLASNFLPFFFLRIPIPADDILLILINFGWSGIAFLDVSAFSKSMKTHLFVVLILLFTACQSGKIPCPDARGPRVKKVKVNTKRHPEYTASINSRRPAAETKYQGQQAKEAEGRFIKNVSVEEWDCPKPGEKKYMPRAIKGNIKRNMKKLNADQKQKAESDSLNIR